MQSAWLKPPGLVMGVPCSGSGPCTKPCRGAGEESGCVLGAEARGPPDSCSSPWEPRLLSNAEPGKNQAAYFWSLNLGLGSYRWHPT